MRVRQGVEDHKGLPEVREGFYLQRVAEEMPEGTSLQLTTKVPYFVRKMLEEPQRPFSNQTWEQVGAMRDFFKSHSQAFRMASMMAGRPEVVRAAAESENLFQFAEYLRKRGLKVDNNPFEWKGHEYLIKPYQDFRIVDEQKIEGDTFVWQCGAQVGKTIGGFLAIIWLSLKFWGQYLGYFLPDKTMADLFSGQRFGPMVQAIPQLKPLWGKNPLEEDVKQGDQMRVRSIGPSKIFFSYMGGTTSTESIPMLGVIFDEVRRMEEGDIERAEERISHSPYPIKFFYSTAGMPDATIDRRYRQTNQHKFHTKCRCPDGVLLADVFPMSIGKRTDVRGPLGKFLPEYFYVCPVCHEIISNPRRGYWIAHNPNGKGSGFHIPQTLSSRQNAEKIFDAFMRARDIQEFYNSKLGVPYLSKESQIVNDDILRATVNPDLKWSPRVNNCSMGIDQMGGFNVIAIRKWGEPDETGMAKSQLVHIEWIESDDPWKRCGELMHKFDVRVCVADALPNYNEALRFAKAFKGRVWLADYSYTPDSLKEICEWMDRPKENVKQKRAGTETKNLYRVRIARFQAIDWNLRLYVDGRKEQPHERGVVQEITDQRGIKIPVYLCEQVMWQHLQKVARRKVVIDESQGKIKMVYENIGLDPHFLHADIYSEIALSRMSIHSAKAFTDFAVKDDESLEKSHDWVQLANPSHYRCEVCKVSIAVGPSESPEDMAAKNGIRCVKPE